MKTELTHEESQHLIDLGVPKEKASSAISVVPIGDGVKDVIKVSKQPIFQLEDFLNGEILPKAIDFDNNLNIHINPIENVCYYDNHFDDFHSITEELINALYQLACWYYGEYLKVKRNEQIFSRTLYSD